MQPTHRLQKPETRDVACARGAQRVEADSTAGHVALPHGDALQHTAKGTSHRPYGTYEIAKRAARSGSDTM